MACIYINKNQNKKLFHLYNFMGEHIFNMHAFKKKKLYTVRREQMPKKDIQLASVLHAMSVFMYTCPFRKKTQNNTLTFRLQTPFDPGSVDGKQAFFPC